jgi:hypothetical protein
VGSTDASVFPYPLTGMLVKLNSSAQSAERPMVQELLLRFAVLCSSTPALCWACWLFLNVTGY